jgi:hypothetical protein
VHAESNSVWYFLRTPLSRKGPVAETELRHIDLLLKNPWAVEIDATNGHPTAETRRVQLPNPASFLAQKALIHHKRDRIDRAKDVLYIHDIIEAFGGALTAIRKQWVTDVKSGLHTNGIRKIEKAADVLFAEVDDTIREAAPHRRRQEPDC